MALQDFLAAVLNPNGVWSNGGPQIQQAMPGLTRVNDVGGPMGGALIPQRAPAPPQMPQQAPQQAAPQQQGGGMGGLGDLFASIFAPQSKGRNETIHWLTQQGYDPGTARVIASDKGALRSVILGRGQGNEFSQRAAAAQQYGLDPNSDEFRAFVLGGKLGGDGEERTADLKEYQFAKSQGFEGSFEDWQVRMKEAGRTQVNLDTGAKLPAGYMWVDPNDQDKGVQPIPGGPATQLPSEAAGRLGLADSFLSNFDEIKRKAASGQITGPIDRFRSTNDSSYEGAETYRQIQTGVDSLQRMLTGAGMPESEAKVYAFRYLPAYTDDAKSMVTKLDRLKTELESVQNKVMQGRGAPAPATAASTQADGNVPPPSYEGDPKLWKYMTPEQRKLWQ